MKMLELFHIGELGFVALTEELDAEAETVIRDLVRRFNEVLRTEVVFNANRLDMSDFPANTRNVLYDRLIKEAENSKQRIGANG